MGPPLSPKEPRRSNRRSAPSGSTSTSKSPDSDAGPRPQRPALATNHSSSRGKKPKQEDMDEDTISAAQPTPTNGRNKRKAKDKDKTMNGEEDGELKDTDDQSVIRCICANSDPDFGEFMMQCEDCDVWQHGGCMGFTSEEEIQNLKNYYCEKCRPEFHIELSKKSKKARQSSISNTTNNRLSRSHSPSQALKQQQSKRRNTMNSRDAAFDENLKEILETTAAEAGTVADTASLNGHMDPDEELDVGGGGGGGGGRKKRRRSDDDAVSAKKRSRSMSTTSDLHHPADSALPEEDATRPAASKGGRNKRGGGRKSANHEATPVSMDGATPTGKKGGNTGRGKAKKAAVARGEDTGPRRNQANGVNGQSASAANDARAYRNSHAYAVSQQTLYHSWNLPDYLSHLSHQLPSEVPRPLEIRSGRGESVELERGVKVKWPSKRMSVVDMNKRVRALLEWVGREQASALERDRRKKSLQDELTRMDIAGLDLPHYNGGQDDMDVDPAPPRSVPPDLDDAESTLIMGELEKLMEELIGFQERFGPGVKTRERDRRTLAAA